MFVNGSNHPYGCIQQCQSEGHWNNTPQTPNLTCVVYFNSITWFFYNYSYYYERVTFLFIYSDSFVLQSTIRISTQ